MPDIDEIKDIIIANPMCTPKDICLLFKPTYHGNTDPLKGAVRKRLNRLLRDGDIIKMSKGVYCHVDYVPSGEVE